MGQINIKQSARNIIESVHKKITESGFNSSNIEEKKYNYEFIVNFSGKKIKIQVYFGKKGNTIVLQGDQNSYEYNRIKSVVFDESPPEITNDNIEYDEYIGTDECGKGDYFGPLVVAAVYVNKETSKILRKLGVRDSKDLSDSRINSLAPEIISIIKKDNYEVYSLEPAEYNKKYEEFRNLNSLLTYCHSKVVSKLLNRVKCNLVITDKFSNRELNIHPSINTVNVKVIMETGAEKYTGVAAASILARYKFNEWFIMQKERFGIELPKGSSFNVINAAAKFETVELEKIAKLHFKVTQKLR
ncbi:ribonuclease HIII [Melioribacter sp. OK-6-Me]